MNNSGIKEKNFVFHVLSCTVYVASNFSFSFFFSKTLNVTHRIFTRYEIARVQKKSLRNRLFKGELNDTYPKNNYFFHCPWTFSGRWRHEKKIIHTLALPSSSNHETRLHVPRNTMTKFPEGTRFVSACGSFKTGEIDKVYLERRRRVVRLTDDFALKCKHPNARWKRGISKTRG